jgi:hypothetical protein
VADDGLEGLDAMHPFQLKARPSPPSTRRARPPGRAWAGGPGLDTQPEAARYHLQVARDAAFQDIVAQQDDLRDTGSTADPGHAGTYHWRLASERADGDRGPWGDGQRFELRPCPSRPRCTPARTARSS